MRMRTLTPLCLLAAFCLHPTGANAAPEGDYHWITPVAGWANFSNRIFYPTDSLKSAPIFGVRIGRAFQENWGIELAGAYSPTKEAAGLGRDVTYTNASFNLMYSPIRGRAGELYLAIAGGYSTRKNKDFIRRDGGTFEQALGWRSWWNDKAGIRLEVRNSLNIARQRPERSDKADQHYLAGIDFAFGGKPKDTDGDGVPDKKDKCPNTPAGAKVDATGCPTDADGDGVWDGLDKCPDTPKGAKVDADGCPIVVTEKETELLDTGMIRLQNVNFETGKSDLLPESFPILDDVGPILRKWPQLQIEVGGHTDSRGTTARNQTLSEARANAVRNYLLKKFPDIVASQLSAKGYGESRPIAPNKGVANMAKNRRVEFVVLNKDVLKKEVEKRKMLQK